MQPGLLPWQRMLMSVNIGFETLMPFYNIMFLSVSIFRKEQIWQIARLPASIKDRFNAGNTVHADIIAGHGGSALSHKFIYLSFGNMAIKAVTAAYRSGLIEFCLNYTDVHFGEKAADRSVNPGLTAHGAGIVDAHPRAMVIWIGEIAFPVQYFPERDCRDAAVVCAETPVAAGAYIYNNGSFRDTGIVAAAYPVHFYTDVFMAQKGEYFPDHIRLVYAQCAAGIEVIRVLHWEPHFTVNS